MPLRTRIAGQPVVLQRTVRSFDEMTPPFVSWWCSANVDNVYGLGIETDMGLKDEAEAMTNLEWNVVVEMVQRDFAGHSPSNGGMVKSPAYFDVVYANPTTDTILELEALLNDLYGDWRTYVMQYRDRYDC